MSDLTPGNGIAKLRWRSLIMLWTLVAAEVLFYPRLVQECFRTVGIRGGIGGEIGVYWLFCIVPGAVLFSIGAAILSSYAVRRWPRHRRKIWIWLWFANILLLAISVAIYVGIERRFSD